ncbi:MAG: helix-turn-helix domain-containing protein [Piscinibacter sp.]|nr:helix-turn-helix domain-containing protein [Piscinibacter sp.]
MDLMTMADVCMALQVSRKTVYRMIAAGLLPEPKKVGNFRQFYFRRKEFEVQCKKALR